MKFDVETTIRYDKNKLNESFIFGGLELNQYFIYKNGEQEDKDKNKIGEAMTYYYEYSEPVLLDDNKSLQDYDILDNELLHLKVQLKLLLKVPCCRFSTIYIFTDNTLKHIQEKTIELFIHKLQIYLKPKQISVFMVINT